MHINSIIYFYKLSIRKEENMYKIALTSRKTSSYYFLYQNYYQFLSSYFDIEITTPRLSHQYQDIVSRNDALLITGGDDINPKYYHHKPLSKTNREDQFIERMDFDLIAQFHKQKKLSLVYVEVYKSLMSILAEHSIKIFRLNINHL